MDEDDDAPQGKGGGGKQQDSIPLGPAMGPVYLMWENTLEKLKILGYEASYLQRSKHTPRPALSRVHFAVPLKNASAQFDDFIDLCSWLCQECSNNPDLFRKDALDDPSTASNKLLLALRQLDFKASFPAQKLRTPHGEQVCMVLEFLADKALEKKHFTFKQPVYQDAMENNEAEDADAANDDEVLDDINDDDDHHAYGDSSNDGAGDASLSHDASSHMMMQQAGMGIDPVLWKSELERVGPKLKAQLTLSAHEWRAHVDQTLSSKEQIDKILVAAQSDLVNMNRVVSEEISRTRTKEKYISHQFAGLCTEFQEIKKRWEEYDVSNRSSNERVGKLTAALNEVSDRLDELKESFDSKDSSSSDTSPLVRIKAALQHIKAEIQAFDLRLGVVSHSLLAVRVAVANRKRLQAALKNKKRRMQGKAGGLGAGGGRMKHMNNDDDDSIGSLE